MAARTSSEYGFRSEAKKTIGTAVAKSHTARAAANPGRILNASTAKSTRAATLAVNGTSRSDSSLGPSVKTAARSSHRKPSGATCA